jgi:hypothetical protein
MSTKEFQEYEKRHSELKRRLTQAPDCISHSDKGYVVYSKQQMDQMFSSGKTRFSVISYRNSNHCLSVYFYVSDHLFGYGVLPKSFVTCSTAIPNYVVPRPTLPSGVIKDRKDYEKVFQEYDYCIETIDELCDFVIKIEDIEKRKISASVESRD